MSWQEDHKYDRYLKFEPHESQKPVNRFDGETLDGVSLQVLFYNSGLEEHVDKAERIKSNGYEVFEGELEEEVSKSELYDLGISPLALYERVRRINEEYSPVACYADESSKEDLFALLAGIEEEGWKVD